MAILLFFTQVMYALVSSNTNLGTKMPKNDATITSKNDDATVKITKPKFLDIFLNCRNNFSMSESDATQEMIDQSTEPSLEKR